ncbi:hypothetical protein D3C72_906000 [compost metagenome]
MKTTIKSIGAFALAALLMISTMSFTTVNDDSKTKKAKKETTPVRKEMQVAAFETVKVSGNFKVMLSQGNEQKIIIEAPEEMANAVQSFVSENELNIYTTDAVKKKITLWVTLKDIHNISTYGDVKVVKE